MKMDDCSRGEGEEEGEDGRKRKRRLQRKHRAWEGDGVEERGKPGSPLGGRDEENHSGFHSRIENLRVSEQVFFPPDY